MSVGGGVVMWATKAGVSPAVGAAAGVSAGALPAAGVTPAVGVSPATASPPPASLAPAFYAARGHGWRDYWTLLHPPYTIWLLSYVLLGAALAPAPEFRIVVGALVAFGLAVGVGSHSFDELQGRPLRTRIPSPVLVAMGTAALLAASAIGVVGVTMFGPLFGLFVLGGASIVVLYGFEVPLVHSDMGFALGWGAFPVLATAYAAGAHPVPMALGALAAALLSLAQRRLSTRTRSIRRRAVSVSGTIVYSDGSTESIDARSLIGALEAALSILWFAIFALSLAVLLAHWL
jgi:hypothetical protein